MISTIDFHGHTVVAPITGKDMEMVAPLEDYFMPLDSGWQNDPDSVAEILREYFEDLSEQQKKQKVRIRDDHKCLFCKKAVETNEVHEIMGKGASGPKAALVPYNQVTVCRYHHNLLQQYKWTIYRFDPLDKENGLIVIGQDGSPIPKDELWFYNRPDKDLVEEADGRFHAMEEAIKANKHNMAKFAENSVWMKEHDGANILGLGTHKSMIAQIGANTALDHKYRSIYERATARGVWNRIQQIDPDRAYKILKGARVGDDYEWLILDDDLERWMGDAEALSTADFNRVFSDSFGHHRRQKRFAVNGAVQMYEIEPGDPDGMDAEIVIDGGEVIKGEVS